LLIEARNEADTVLVHAGRALKQGADLVPADERAAIEAAVPRCGPAREGDDRDRIHRGHDGRQSRHRAPRRAC